MAALLLLCSSAAAQGLKIELPLPDGAAGDVLPGDTVEQAITEPLPEPVEQVVDSSPVAPLRDEVQRVVGQDTGGGGGGGGGTAQPSTGSGSSAGGTAQPTTGGAGSGGNSGGGADRDGNGGSGNRERGAGADGGAGTATGDGAPDGGAGAGGGQAERAARRRAAAESDGNAVTRTIQDIVHVIPTYLWIALGVLAAFALALGARALVNERRARRLERERERLVRDVGFLERALLPPVPERLGGLAASVAYRSCQGPAAGGDFYDAFELSDGRAAMLVGDVSGHGPEALEQTNSIRIGLHACLEGGMSPRRALESVGRSAASAFDGGFATVVVALHDPRAGTLTYATAGHPPPIVVGPSTHEPVTAASAPPIGFGFRTGLRQTTVPLPPGSVVCLFTDGILEARTTDGMLGRGRLTELVAGLEPGEGADELLERVTAATEEAPDDMAVCVVRAGDGAAGLAYGPRVEELELDAEEASNGIAARFLEACELDGEAAAVFVEELRAATAANGAAVLAVTLDDGEPHVAITPVRTPAATPAEAGIG